MLANVNIHDVWRTNHPDKKEYTWFKQTPFTAKRIDYIFFDFFLVTSFTKITNTSIEGFSHSDHKLVKVKIHMNSLKSGPGYWKFNSLLLSEADFVAEANSFIDANKYISGGKKKKRRKKNTRKKTKNRERKKWKHQGLHATSRPASRPAFCYEFTNN